MIEVTIIVRKLTRDDIPEIVKAFKAQGWNKPSILFEKYLEEQEIGKRYTLVAFKDDCFAGYGCLMIEAETGPFKEAYYPEIKDLNVIKIAQGYQIGTNLMRNLEKIASTYSNILTLAVGLHEGYGRAQRLYASLGYEPDGSGAWYQDQIAIPYQTYPLDDGFVIYMKKDLTIKS